jgi:hypothetical protein
MVYSTDQIDAKPLPAIGGIAVETRVRNEPEMSSQAADNRVKRSWHPHRRVRAKSCGHLNVMAQNWPRIMRSCPSSATRQYPEPGRLAHIVRQMRSRKDSMGGTLT